MLSLLKKKSEATAAPALPAWHPNFRNFEKLPDIKVVRTAFFVNGAAIAVTLALAIFFGMHEWQLHVLKGQIVEAQKRIQRGKAGSDAAVAQFKKFQTEEARITELDTFLKSKPLVSELLLHIGETLPPAIAIDSIDLRETGIVLRFSVRGTPVTSAGYANNYVEQLKADPKLMERFGGAEMTSISQNPATGRMAVEVLVPAKAAKKP